MKLRTTPLTHPIENRDIPEKNTFKKKLKTSRKLHKLRIFSEDFHLLTSVLLIFSEGLPQFNGDRTISSKSDNI